MGYPRPAVAGTPLLQWQANVLTRWSDGSVQHSLISFALHIGAAGTVTVNFVDDRAPCHLLSAAACDAAAPDAAGILDFNSGDWGAEIRTTNGASTASANAREMITAGAWRFWIKGPLANVVIVEDRSPARSYDFGWQCTANCATPGQYNASFDYAASTFRQDATHRNLHPIFVITLFAGWPGVKEEFIVENNWTQTLQDSKYDLILKSGAGLSNSPYSLTGFTHIAASRYRKTYWDGAEPDSAAQDLNFPYMKASGVVANYDPSRVPSAPAIKNELKRWDASDRAAITSSIPNYSGTLYKPFPSAGGRPDIALMPLWCVLYLYSFDQALYEEVIGNAEAMAYAPQHFRESDGARWYDDRHTVSAGGRTVSRDARPGFVGWDLFNKQGTNYRADALIPAGGMSNNNWVTRDTAHQPDPLWLAYLLTGDWYFLEEIYFWASYNLTQGGAGSKTSDCQYLTCGHDDWGYMNESWSETRGIGWSLRMLAHAAFVAPDGSPEKRYFTQKLNYNIAVREGVMNLTTGSFYDPSPGSKWDWGRSFLALGRQNPLGWTNKLMGYFADGDGLVDPAKACWDQAPWQENYILISLGHIKDLGFSAVEGIFSVNAKRFLNMVLNPDYAPKTLIAGYYVGTRSAPPGCQNSSTDMTSVPLTTWADVAAASSAKEISDAGVRWKNGCSDPMGGYPAIAFGAAAFAASVNDGSYSGLDAWAWMKANVTNQNFLNDNPTWAFVPRFTAAATAQAKPTSQTGR